MLVYSCCGVYIVVVCGGAGGGGYDGQSSDDGQGSRPGPEITSAARRHAGRARRHFLHVCCLSTSWFSTRFTGNCHTVLHHGSRQVRRKMLNLFGSWLFSRFTGKHHTFQLRGSLAASQVNVTPFHIVALY